MAPLLQLSPASAAAYDDDDLSAEQSTAAHKLPAQMSASSSGVHGAGSADLTANRESRVPYVCECGWGGGGGPADFSQVPEWWRLLGNGR